MRKSVLIVCIAALCLVPVTMAQMEPSSMNDSELFPPNAKPGECYARVFVAPTYRTDTEQVLKRAESERIETLPARFEKVSETVLAREESERLEVVPAEYGYVEETMMVKPASKRLVEGPARYETLTEQVLDTPAHTIWKKGKGLIQRVDNTTGEILCLVEVPATYKTISKRVVATPASVKEIEVPAEYKTVKKRVVKTPATVRKIVIPAEYDTISVTKMVAEPQVKHISIPAEYQTVSRKVKVTEGRMEWRTVLCETNVSRGIIRRIQSALSAAGYDAGDSDGVIGSRTQGAVRSFQRDKGLAVGNLTMETLKALGVNP
jgi:hypothetical protein